MSKLTYFRLPIESTIHRISCMTSVCLEAVRMQLWCCRRETILTSYLTTARSEPRRRLKHEQPPQKSSSREMSGRLSRCKEGRTLIFRPISSSKSSQTRLHATRSAARPRSRSSAHRRLASCLLRPALTNRLLWRIMSFSTLKTKFVRSSQSCAARRSNKLEWKSSKKRSSIRCASSKSTSGECSRLKSMTSSAWSKLRKRGSQSSRRTRRI